MKHFLTCLQILIDSLDYIYFRFFFNVVEHTNILVLFKYSIIFRITLCFSIEFFPALDVIYRWMKVSRR